MSTSVPVDPPASHRLLEHIWEQVLRSRYDADALPRPSALQFARMAVRDGLVRIRYLRRTLDHVGDEMPRGRRKLIHGVGTTALCELRPLPGHPFTGLYASGGACLLRMSLAVPFGPFVPALALKLPVEDGPSVNLVAMPGMDGQGTDHDPFARTYATTLAPPKRLPVRGLAYLAQRAADSFGVPGVSGLSCPTAPPALVHADGTVVHSPRAPHAIAFEPVAETHLQSATDVDFRVGLAALAPGKRLFRVVAVSSPDKVRVPIADMVLTTGFVASSYGDDRLFFAHDFQVVPTPRGRRAPAPSTRPADSISSSSVAAAVVASPRVETPALDQVDAHPVFG